MNSIHPSAEAEGVLWKGGTQASSFPHRCPFFHEGAPKEQCIEHSGRSYKHNYDNCRGTWRGNMEFPKCTSSARRCLRCLAEGKTGLKANAVVNHDEGTCEQHTGVLLAEQAREQRLASDPRDAHRYSRTRIDLSHFERRPPATSPVVRDILPARVAAAPVLPVHVEVPRAEAPVEPLLRAEYRRLESLDSEEVFVLERVAGSRSLPWIQDELGRSERKSRRDAFTILQHIYAKLRVDGAMSVKQRGEIVSGLYRRFDAMKRQSIEPIEDRSQPDESIIMPAPVTDVKKPTPEASPSGAALAPMESIKASARKAGPDEHIVQRTLTMLLEKPGVLTGRQMKVLRLLPEHVSDAEVANAMGGTTTPNSIAVIVSSIVGELGLRDLARDLKRPTLVEVARRFVTHTQEQAAQDVPDTVPADSAKTVPEKVGGAPDVPPARAQERDDFKKSILEALDTLETDIRVFMETGRETLKRVTAIRSMISQNE